MKIILSAAISLDGCLDDCTPQRLKLSSPEDWDAVLRLRAQCDAILVGGETIRRDNPSLVIRDEALRAERVARGMRADIDKVTLTQSGELDPDAGFFTEGGGRKIVFAAGDAAGSLAGLADRAEIVRTERVTARFIADTLAARGYRILMVEGGSRVLGMFLAEGCADVLRLAVAPFFVGDVCAPRFVPPGQYPWNNDKRMKLDRVEMLGDMAVMWYNLKGDE